MVGTFFCAGPRFFPFVVTCGFPFRFMFRSGFAPKQEASAEPKWKRELKQKATKDHNHKQNLKRKGESEQNLPWCRISVSASVVRFEGRFRFMFKHTSGRHCKKDSKKNRSEIDDGPLHDRNKRQIERKRDWQALAKRANGTATKTEEAEVPSSRFGNHNSWTAMQIQQILPTWKLKLTQPTTDPLLVNSG